MNESYISSGAGHASAGMMTVWATKSFAKSNDFICKSANFVLQRRWEWRGDEVERSGQRSIKSESWTEHWELGGGYD